MTEIEATYDLLSAEFDHTFKDTRGGFTFDYLTGEQVISRLNEVLGVDGWSFKVLEHGIHAEADEAWVLADLAANIPGDDGLTTVVIRQQFGSQKIKRSRQSGTPLDIGFDLKGATTDALKKCATLLGVGLYLSRKEEQESQQQQQQRSAPPATQQRAAAAPPATAQGNGAAPVHIACEICGDELKETRFRDGTVWSPAELASWGRRKYSKALCMAHYREANDARKRADADTADAPF